MTDGSPSFVYVPALAEATGELAIDGEEAHYLRKVVRIRAGESVTATDGRGTLAELCVLDAGPCVRAEVRAVRRVERAVRLTVWCGAPEGDRADWMIEKLAELGVAALVPVDAERGRWERAAARADRWRRLAVAALRQSRSAHLLDIAPVTPLGRLLDSARPGVDAFLADSGGRLFPFREGACAGEASAVIGPSSGFSGAELKRLGESGFVSVRLTAGRLRTETAALALSTLVLAGGAGLDPPA